MCLIIASQTGIIPDEELMTEAYKDNPHGWGIMWAENGQIRAVKGLRLSSWIRNLKRVEGKPYVAHVRWATHGRVGVSNCHPFKVTDDLWIAHNGIIKIDCWKTEMSDTWHFARALRDVSEAYPFVMGRDYRKKLTEYVEKWIGYSNKVVMLRADGEILIANESAGVHYEGMWLSNTNSLWSQRTPASWYTRSSYKPAHYLDALTTFVREGATVDYADEQQCDYCNEMTRTLHRYDGCDICAECYDAEIELLVKYREQVADDGSAMDGVTSVDLDDDDDDGEITDAQREAYILSGDWETGLEDDDDARFVTTELDREIDRLRGELCCDLRRGSVVAIDRGNYQLEEVPF